MGSKPTPNVGDRFLYSCAKPNSQNLWFVKTRYHHKEGIPVKNKYLVLGLAVLVLALLSGCAPECSIEEILEFSPILEAPADGTVIDYANPGTFEWTHQESCVPSYYAVTFINEQGTRDISNFEDGDLTYLRRESPFFPGMNYEWYVTAVHGERDGSRTNFTYGPPSEIRTFKTDGICSAAELRPPMPVYPAQDAQLDGGDSLDLSSLLLKWSYPGDFPGDCYPETFHYQVAADPNFNQLITSGLVAADCLLTEPNAECWAQLTVPRCASLYWRVEARTGNESGGYSDPYQFSYASQPECTEIQPPSGIALIKGFLFADYCWSTIPWVPEGVGIFPPCDFGEPYGVHADGIRNRVPYEHEVLGTTMPAEEGIPDILVDLGSGPCPSTGLNQIYTLNNGGFYFIVPSPGTYCLSIDKNSNPSLDHGIWTLPLTNDDMAQFTVIIPSGEDLILQDFGWDQNDFLKIDYLVEVLSYCRAGDSKDYPEAAILEAGEEIPIIGRNEDATWFAVLVDGKRCFVSIATGSPLEDPDGMLIYPDQPDPDLIEKVVDCTTYTTRASCILYGCAWEELPGASHCFKFEP